MWNDLVFYNLDFFRNMRTIWIQWVVADDFLRSYFRFFVIGDQIIKNINVSILHTIFKPLVYTHKKSQSLLPVKTKYKWFVTKYWLSSKYTKKSFNVLKIMCICMQNFACYKNGNNQLRIELAILFMNLKCCKYNKKNISNIFKVLPLKIFQLRIS